MSTIFRVEKYTNYTVMANYHLKDRRLSFKAKGLMSEMLSLPPDWDYTLSGLACIAADGIDSVRTAIRELENCGYLVRSQCRDERGRMSVNEYVVYENPEQNPAFIPPENDNFLDSNSVAENKKNGAAKPNAPSLKNPMTVENDVETTEKEACSFGKPVAEKPSPENPTTATLYRLNTHKSSTQKSNHSINRAGELRKTDMIDSNSALIAERNAYLEVIKSNIDYDYLVQASPDDRKRIDEIVSIMLDVICSKRRYIRVNGEDCPRETVKAQFLKLNSEHIDYVLTALKKNTSDVRNIRSYLITALYNAPLTMDNFYTSLVNHDMYGKSE